MPRFSEQEILQTHALQNIIIRKRQTCFKQADVWTLLKRTPEKNARTFKENLPSPPTLTLEPTDLQRKKSLMSQHLQNLGGRKFCWPKYTSFLLDVKKTPDNLQLELIYLQGERYLNSQFPAACLIFCVVKPFKIL